MTDRWRLSAIIAYGVKMHWAGQSRGCCLRHEMSCAARDDDFSLSFLLADADFAMRFSLIGGQEAEMQALEADGIRVSGLDE